MRKAMDAICADEEVWPHAVLAGHAHSYQRFTRHRSDGTEIPYIICGNGGHNVTKLKGQKGAAIRAPQVLQVKGAHEDHVDFENYDDTDYGYLRVIADAKQLRIEYHPAPDGLDAKTPDDSVTIDLASRKRTTYDTNNLGLPGEAQAVRDQVAEHAKRQGKGKHRRAD
jgi:hypothetical protein